ncbi:hypothetical protein [Parvularcula dongshanensis]|uniref:BPP domain-containing protein n=1 Tax=Parvularcula dongshanensis TaxID=1173995 RepID=A0A840I2Q5_9PROT|nr:hypothetical protein [Parvularcula dongshanensis]MBB4658572.1 hypothetical protein [Parvularcula dongshanensis]
MTRSLLLAAATAALLSACGDREAEVPPVPEEAAAPAPAESESAREAPQAEVAVSDVLGSFGGETYGMAVWAHPTLSFEGAVLVANGDAGLAVVPIDSDVAMSTVEGTFDGPVAVSYPDDGDPSNTLVAAASGEEIVLLDIDPDTRAFNEVGRLPAPDGTRALCARGDLLLRADGGGRVSLSRIEIGDGRAVRTEETPLRFATSCAAAASSFFVLSEEGLVATLDDMGDLDATYEEAFGEGRVTDLVALSADEDEALLIALDEQDRFRLAQANAPLVSLASAQERGRAGIGALAAGSGNYGSIYRDGVLAVLDQGQTLKLVPWVGLSRSFGVGQSETVGPRTLNAEAVSGPAAPQIELPSSVGGAPGE